MLTPAEPLAQVAASSTAHSCPGRPPCATGPCAEPGCSGSQNVRNFTDNSAFQQDTQDHQSCFERNQVHVFFAERAVVTPRSASLTGCGCRGDCPARAVAGTRRLGPGDLPRDTLPRAEPPTVAAIASTQELSSDAAAGLARWKRGDCKCGAQVRAPRRRAAICWE